jgi:hypothetical protein
MTSEVEIIRQPDGSVSIRLPGGEQNNSVLDALAELFYLRSEPGATKRLGVQFFEIENTSFTPNMQRYLWGHLAVVLLRFLRESGENVRSKELCVKAWKKSVGFCRSEYLGDGKVSIVDLSLSDRFTSQRDKQQFIEDLYIWLLQWGCRVQTPDEYFKTTKINEQ